jgi:monoamine oxidase
MTTRRDFLRHVALAGGWFAFRGLAASTAQAASGKTFPKGTWAGNFPSYCHDIVRDNKPLPPVAASRKAEVVIVGGGLAGLSAAYKLRDMDVLVLEHLDRIGGHALRDRWSDIWYSGASAYFVAPEPPLDALYDELKLPMKKIHEPGDSAILAWNPVSDMFGAGINKLPYPQRVKDDFIRGKKEWLEMADSDDYPVMPLGDTSEASKALDSMTFADWLMKDRKYHPAVKGILDLYCRSAFGAPSSTDVSAFAGLNFWLSEFGDRFTFPGGNAQCAEILRDNIDAAGANRIVSGATVVQVENTTTGVKVTYVDRLGRPSAVEAKAAIVACPKYIAKHVVKGIPADQLAAMNELHYGTYLVANVLCTTPISESAYDTWTDVASFTDFIVADWVTRAPGEKRPGKQVLTVYYPLGYANALILNDDVYDTFRNEVVMHLDLLYPGAEAKIEDVRLYRWGHALCHAGPGWYTKQSEINRRPLGRILFGHSDNQGLPAFESALAEGLLQSEAARALVKA